MKKIFLMLSVVLFGSTVFGAGNQQAEHSDIGLQDLIQVCQRLERNPQIKPFSSEVICRGHKTYWRQKEVVEVPMDTEFYVRSEVIMKGSRYEVTELVSQMTSDPEPAQCNIYEEVRVEYSPVSVRLNSCDDLQKLADNGRDYFCSGQLNDDQLITKDAKVTGRTFNSCM